MIGMAATEERLEGVLRTRDDQVLTWGASLRAWTLAPLRSQVLRAGPFGEGGCLTDLDADGRDEFISVRGPGLGTLLWMPLGSDVEERIDTQIEMGDCIQAEFFGRRGLLMVQRGAQIRFYQRTAGSRWIVRDIYSIYTPSYQRGLALADVDGDDRKDIFAGNYWIRSPERFEESWRLFAINTWFEEAESAALRIAVMSPRRIVAAQARITPARFAVFAAPADPAQLWSASPVPHELGRVRALDVWQGQIVAGGDGGLMIGTARVSDVPVTGFVPAGEDLLFVAGPGGARLVSHRPPRK